MRSWGCIGAALLLLESAAGAYDQRVHVLLSARAYGGRKRIAADASANVVLALRERLWRAGANARDPELRRRFLARYSASARFDAWEMKRLFGLNPDRPIAGLDETPLPDGGDGRAIYAMASRLPDDDLRNQDRFRHDAARQVMTSPYGEPLPADPATLEMGKLTGLSSQAHAHYALPRISFSDDPVVLKNDPRRFAVPPTVHTFGAEFAELYTALAVLADRQPGGERLALVYAGAAAHHIEDVANQIHTVQVGLYAFFVDAKIQSLEEELLSVGGILRPRPTFLSIGIDLISNHHSLVESLFAKHLLGEGDPVAKLSAPGAPDPEFAAALEGIGAGCSGFGRAIAQSLADRSSFEGSTVYAAIRAVADRRLSRAGQHFGDGDDPDRAIRPGADLTHFFELEARGARRSDQALAAWWSRFTACHDGAEEASIAEALLASRLDSLDAEEARARAWLPAPPAKETINGWIPAGCFSVLVALTWVGRRVAIGRRTSNKRGTL